MRSYLPSLEYTMHSNAQSIKTNRRNESRSVIIICHERKLFLLILHNANQVCDVRNLIIWSKQCRLHKRLLHFLLYVCPPPKKIEISLSNQHSFGQCWETCSSADAEMCSPTNDQGKTCQDIHKMKGEKLPPV